MVKYFLAGATALVALFWLVLKYDAAANITISLPPLAEEHGEAEETANTAHQLIIIEPTSEEPEEVVIIDTKEKTCLAKAIFFEARSQSIEGKIAVATVVLNRVKTGMYPNTICEVVNSGCQFSWNCDGKTKYNPAEVVHPVEKRAWVESLMLANDIILEYNSAQFNDITDGATYFHASYVYPHWRKWRKLQRTVRIDKHIFYKVRE